MDWRICLSRAWAVDDGVAIGTGGFSPVDSEFLCENAIIDSDQQLNLDKEESVYERTKFRTPTALSVTDLFYYLRGAGDTTIPRKH